MGTNRVGIVTHCYSTGVISVTGNDIGGLVGANHDCVDQSYSTGAVNGNWTVGGLVGWNPGTITDSYSAANISGDSTVGGLVGTNWGDVIQCYSRGKVNGSNLVGGLVGHDWINFGHVRIYGNSIGCFWDNEASGRATSAGGEGKTTAEMKTSSTFLEAGWDFVDEIENDTEDIWWIDEGNDYPRLLWELIPEN